MFISCFNMIMWTLIIFTCTQCVGKCSLFFKSSLQQHCLHLIIIFIIIINIKKHRSFSSSSRPVCPYIYIFFCISSGELFYFSHVFYHSSDTIWDVSCRTKVLIFFFKDLFFLFFFYTYRTRLTKQISWCVVPRCAWWSSLLYLVPFYPFFFIQNPLPLYCNQESVLISKLPYGQRIICKKNTTFYEVGLQIENRSLNVNSFLCTSSF